MDTLYFISFTCVLALFIYVIYTISRSQKNSKVKGLHYRSMPIIKTKSYLWK
ncbi:MAG TPA: hypothetical protein VG961_08100 [Ignavibacteria bacterium]|nr:hypothetical protein [Ignavibacteria bacterium]